MVQLEYLERDGGPAVWLVCALLALIGLGGLFAITRKEKKNSLRTGSMAFDMYWSDLVMVKSV